MEATHAVAAFVEDGHRAEQVLPHAQERDLRVSSPLEEREAASEKVNGGANHRREPGPAQSRRKSGVERVGVGISLQLGNILGISKFA
ncbi:MAG: hypothetical protein H0U00_05750 [Actinobacteria bacterium]|nr:hypothetical protein [Actinomycetota bacterium]